MTPPVVVILAAGEGTRMRSAVPKLLHPLCGQPMITWPVAAAREAGAARIVVVDNPARRLEGALNDSRVDLRFAIQEEPRGTADAVNAARDEFAPLGGSERTPTVIVLNGDVPLIRPETIKALAEARERAGAGATLATTVFEDPRGYGRIVRAADGTVERVVETKAEADATEDELAIREINAGIYAFDAGLLADALEQVKPDNAQGELYLPDVLPLMRAQGARVTAYEIDDHPELLGINDRVQLAVAREVAQRRILERHMVAGVTIVDPASTVVDIGVRIAQDTVIAPFSNLHGATSIGAGARIGPLTTIIDSEVGEAASVVHSYATGAQIGPRASVGPFAYLRPGAILRERSKAGTFVEIKNSDVGAGSKVPHLSYIGDTDIGEGTNIGAGTITANYDGTNKNRTTIGAGAFVSVDTMLVAPVSVGDGAYTGAGSVITKDVPPGALGVARSRQQNIEGYAERRRQRAEAERREREGVPGDAAPGDRARR